jgi:hypothetical protein
MHEAGTAPFCASSCSSRCSRSSRAWSGCLSGNVMHFYSVGLLRMAYETAQRADIAAAADPYHLTHETLVAIVLATSAADALVNDLVGCIRLLSEHGALTSGEDSRLVAIGEAIEAMEEAHAQIRPKYLAAAVLLGCRSIRRGATPFQAFNDLVILRNGIIHARPVSLDETGIEARIVNALAQRGLVGAGTNIPGYDTWWVRVRTAAVAWWAADSAYSLMLELVNGVVAIADYKGVIAGFGDQLRGVRRQPS